jgi:calcium-dependent protein kinase
MLATCGSVAYVSPDVLLGHGYSSQCDLWSLGVIVFMLLAGYPPFHGSDFNMRKSIVAAEVDWHHPRRWAKVSNDAIDFVKGLLARDPKVRLDAQTAVNHRWLTSSAPINKAVLSAAAIRSISNYAGAPSFRRAVLQLVARELSPNDVTDLRHAFLDMAGDEEGTVRISELKAAIRGDVSTQCIDSDPKTPARRLRRAKTEKLAELFQVMDINGDEQVYYSDFLAATMNQDLNFREEHIRAAFCRLDADNSGAISMDDIQNTIGETFEGVETRLLMRDAGLSPSAQDDISFDAFIRAFEDPENHTENTSDGFTIAEI